MARYAPICLLWLLLVHSRLASQPINRKAVAERHIVVNAKFDTLSSLTVGNGAFAFTVDATGMQSFPQAYAKGVPLGTQSEWGWHSFKDTAHYLFEETLKAYRINGRYVPYSVQLREPERNRDAVNWFRVNPHRLQLGNIGMEILKKDGTPAGMHDITGIHQELNPWTGEVHSLFTVEGETVEVFTYAHQQQDIVSFRILSPLLQQKRIVITVRLPYPNGDFKDAGVTYTNADKHSSALYALGSGARISHALDSTRYFISLQWNGKAKAIQRAKHVFVIAPGAAATFELTCLFSQNVNRRAMPGFMQTASDSRQHWQQFWQSGGAVDFGSVADARAFELERRVVLSQYLTRVQCAGNYPPQETGLTYNSWYGKPHLEMHWWHAIHFALWGRIDLMEKSLGWYAAVYNEAKKIALRQGYAGIRWQKMTDPSGKESPSSVGAFLIWQQPHFIYFSELAYRAHANTQTLNKYKDLVFATADFMASFAVFDPVKERYILGKGVIPAQERFKAEETFNPTYELVYWHWALQTAQQWRRRLHLPRNKKWDDVLKRLSPLPVQDGKYLFTESGTDSYTNPEYRGDHPSVLGAYGMLPYTGMIDTGIMQNTFNWIMHNWWWKDTWGWDYPMAAMTATRLNMPARALDALLMPVQKNTYLNNGHNFQDDRLTIYLPGNGGLLAAVAMMCAGYDSSVHDNPGILPEWNVRWEGLQKMP